MNKQMIKRASIFRILSNSTANVISFIILFFLLGQLVLVNLPQLYLKVIVIGLMIGDALLIAVVTIIEYRYSFLVIDEDTISYHQPLNKKKNFEKKLSEIKSMKVASASLLIEFADQKILLDYLSKPRELLKIIQEKTSI